MLFDTKIEILFYLEIDQKYTYFKIVRRVYGTIK